MSETNLMRLSSRLDRMEESATLRMAQLAREQKAKGRDVISLSLGEPDFDTPEHIKAAAVKALHDGFTKYTPVPGLPELREAIQHKFKRDNDLHFEMDQIVVSNGAKQSIANIFMALLDPGDEVLVFSPYWVSYSEIIKLAGGTPVELYAGIEQDYKVTPDQVRDFLSSKTRAVLFSSPCNPTGSVYSRSELEAIAEVLREYPEVVVVSDEIYEYINFTEEHASIGNCAAVRDRTVTVNGFSKGFAMTGWRLGYIGAPLWIAQACTKIQGQITSGATAFGQKAAAYALKADMQPTHDMRTAFLQRRDMITHLLAEIPGMIVNKPQGAFYLFPDISSFFDKTSRNYRIRNADDLAEYILFEADVALVTGSAFGAQNCLRISYAASEQELRTAAERMKRVLTALQ